MNEEKTLSEILKGESEAHNMSATKLAEASGVPERYVAALMNGEFTLLPPAPYIRGYLIRISSILGAQGEEMADVAGRILDGLGGKRASPPIRSLEPFALVDGYAKHISDEGCQAYFGNAGETGGDAGIEQVADAEPAAPVDAAHIVVGCVNHFLDGGICQNFFQRSQFVQGNCVYDIDFPARSNLNQAELLGVVVEAV